MGDINHELSLHQVASLTQSYKSRFQWLEDDLVSFQRQDAYATPHHEFDTQPELWGFFLLFNSEPHPVQLVTENGLFTAPNGCFLWFPRYSIIEWALKACQIHWCGYISKGDPPDDLPTKATVYQMSPEQLKKMQTNGLPQSKQEIYEIVRGAWPRGLVERHLGHHPVAQTLKYEIQKRYKEEIKISEIAEKLGFSHEYLLRSFQKCYGITPVYFRTRLRVFSTVFALLEGKPVTQVALESGFADLCQFTRQFKKHMKVPPLAYRWKDDLKT